MALPPVTSNPRSAPMRRSWQLAPGGRRLMLFAALAAVLFPRPALPRTAPEGPRPWAPGRLYLKVRETPTAAKTSPALQAALGPALDSARPIARRLLGPLPAGI